MSVSLVRAKKFNQKRKSDFMIVHVVEGQNPDAGEVDGTADGDYHIGNLPPDAIVYNSGIFVIGGSDAATSCVGSLGTALGGAQILSAADLTTAGMQGTPVVSHTGSGKEVWFRRDQTGAATDVGEYVIIIEYVELEKTTGGFTTLTEAA